MILPLLNATRRKLIGNMFWLYLLQGLNYVIPVAVLPYLLRVLGVERYGLIAFAQAFAQYFVLLSDYGFNLSATKQIAVIRHDRERVLRLFWCVILIKLALMLLGAVVTASTVLMVPRFRADAELYAIAYLAVLGSVLFPVWLFQGMEKMGYISVVSGGAKILSALLLFVLVRQRSDYVLALAIQSGGLLLAGIAGLWIAVTHFKIAYAQPSKTELAQTLRDGWHLFVSNASAALYTTSYVFFVGLLAGNTQAGYYSAAEKIVRGIQGTLSPMTTAIYPHVSELAAKSGEMALSFIRKILAWIALVSFIPSAALLLFARPITGILFGNAADGIVAPLRWTAALPFVVAISAVLAIQTMIPFGLEKQLSRIYVVAGLGSLIFCLPLIHYFGAAGAGAGVLVVETSVVVAMWGVLTAHGLHFGRRGKALLADATPGAKVSPDALSC